MQTDSVLAVCVAMLQQLISLNTWNHLISVGFTSKDTSRAKKKNKKKGFICAIMSNVKYFGKENINNQHVQSLNHSRHSKMNILILKYAKVLRNTQKLNYQVRSQTTVIITCLLGYM